MISVCILHVYLSSKCVDLIAQAWQILDTCQSESQSENQAQCQHFEQLFILLYCPRLVVRLLDAGNHLCYRKLCATATHAV